MSRMVRNDVMDMGVTSWLGVTSLFEWPYVWHGQRRGSDVMARMSLFRMSVSVLSDLQELSSFCRG